MEKEFVSNNSKIIIGNMSLSDKKTYLDSLKKYMIEYRDSLGINNTFGIEIEYEGVDYSYMIDKLYNYTGWVSTEEKGFDVGGEIVSPILKDDVANWQDIKDVLNMIDSTYGTIDNGGAHVHVGAHSLKNYDNLVKLLLLYSVYERVLYRFGFMDRLNPRKTMISAASPIALDIAADIEEIIDSSNIKCLKNRYERFFGINFNNLSSLTKIGDKNTVEFRFANNTFNPVLWQNHINTCCKLLNASTKDLDVDRLLYLLYRLREDRINYYNYGSVDINIAIEFSDLIFDNMLDKTNFLRQYIKDGSKTVDSPEKVYSKPFTKEC